MSRHIVEVVRCDKCDTELTPDQVTTREFVWLNRPWQIDLCEPDLKTIDDLMDEITIVARRLPTEAYSVKGTRNKRTPYAEEPRFDQWKNDAGIYVCPYTWNDQSGEHYCRREFKKPNGLAVHHQRTHGVNL